MRVEFEPQTLVTAAQTIQVDSGQTSTGRVEMWSEAKAIVANTSEGAPLVNTALRFVNDTTDIMVKTDAEGHATANLPLGDFEVSHNTRDSKTGPYATHRAHLTGRTASSDDEPEVTLTFE